MNAELCISEWWRGQSALQSAAVLHRDALYPDSVSRAYYAILHGMRAALATKEDLIPNSHNSARTLFNQHLIHTGEIEREWLDYFNRARAKRTVADYDALTVITEPMAAIHHREADHFTTRIRRYLQTQGFTDSALAVILPP